MKIEDNIKIINTSSFLRMELGNITGKRNCEYIYKIGENIDNMEVLDTIRMKNGKSTCKGYKLKCLSDGYEWESTEYNILKGKRCPVCCNSPHVIIKGINDIATTHPYLVKYFVDIEDAYNNSYSSTKTVRMKCPNCKKNINKRIELLRYGYICPICNKSTSMPNRFMYSLLDELSLKYNIVNFKNEFSGGWLKNRRYDFYFEYNNEKYIVEMNGKQHYINGGFEKLGGRSLEEEKNNDKLKKKEALNNGIDNYIVIDCRESNFEWIKNNIIHSKLNDIFDLNNVIDWNNIIEDSQKSITKEVCNYWYLHNDINNEGLSIKYLENIFNISNTTIRTYLKIGTELGWCTYIP